MSWLILSKPDARLGGPNPSGTTFIQSLSYSVWQHWLSCFSLPENLT
jgi:hypothetical protein